MTEKAHQMIWQQRLIHLSPGTIQEVYKHVNGVPNLSRFEFDDISNCTTCTKANLCKNSLTRRSLTKMVTCPYQGLFIDFIFLGRISYDKEGKMIPSTQEDIEGINGETAWILITDAQKKCTMVICD